MVMTDLSQQNQWAAVLGRERASDKYFLYSPNIALSSADIPSASTLFRTRLNQLSRFVTHSKTKATSSAKEIWNYGQCT
jgi:hypothetical protein